MEIRVENLHKHFGKTHALKGITFSFGEKEIYGFVGPNGSGKTTTLRILAAIDEASSGDAFINGFSVTYFPEKVREMVGFVPDSLPELKDITVHEYLDFFARAYGLKGEVRKKRIQGVEDFTGLIPIREKQLTQLSKGMKQRVSLARALVHDPPVLLMDEPASGLDPRARIELRELIKILSARGKAILISSHILSELTEICTGAVIIEKGEILSTGSIDELVTTKRDQYNIIIRGRGSQEELLKTLMEMPEVSKVTPDGNFIFVSINGGEEESCNLLAGLVKKGHGIVEFSPQKDDLEDIFMRVTKGEVQ